MIPRRVAMAAPFLLAAGRAGAATGEPPGGRLAFQVFRKGSQIGTHTLEFRRSGTTLVVRIDVAMAVGIGPITLYRYGMSATETWREDRFAELDAATNDDGDKVRVTASRSAAGVAVDSSTLGKQTFPADALPLTHWNIGNMTAPLFNPQNGKPMQLTVKPLGASRVALASGAEVAATHFSLTGDSTLDDWYDGDNVWAGLRALAPDGSIVEYRRAT